MNSKKVISKINAHAISHEEELKMQKEGVPIIWIEALKKGLIADDVEKRPDLEFGDEWTGWLDFFGYNEDYWRIFINQTDSSNIFINHQDIAEALSMANEILVYYQSVGKRQPIDIFTIECFIKVLNSFPSDISYACFIESVIQEVGTSHYMLKMESPEHFKFETTRFIINEGSGIEPTITDDNVIEEIKAVLKKVNSYTTSVLKSELFELVSIVSELENSLDELKIILMENQAEY